MITPNINEFLKLTKKGNLIPIYKEIVGDVDTPVSAYFKISSTSKYSFLLESVEGEEKIARFSFLAKDPQMIIKTKEHSAEITHFKNGKQIKEEKKTFVESPLELIRDILKKYKFVDNPQLPRFCGGIVGFLSYDTVRFFERLPSKNTDDLKLPDLYLILTKDLIIFDHRNHLMKIISCVEIDPKSSDATKKTAYQNAIKKIESLEEDLSKSVATQPKSSQNNNGSVESNFTQKEFENIVIEAKKKIKAGDIIQVVLSQRFETKLSTDAFNIYRALRSLNPSPYMYYLNFNDVKIAGSSPELLVRCEHGIVETRPIAGTRPRGKSPEEDAQLAKDLLNDPKEKAEHIMLVDLGRNDLGRVCEEGSVKISEFMSIEKYSHVMHIVSNVVGKLSKDKDAFDVLQAAFPAGTVSGAPKIRAMEIIDELENKKRGPYAGCIGYFSFSGNLDTCITIRTIVVKNNKAYVQAGAGIVADSNPATEYLETMNKAKAQIMAIEKAKSLNSLN